MATDGEGFGFLGEHAEPSKQMDVDEGEATSRLGKLTNRAANVDLGASVSALRADGIGGVRAAKRCCIHHHAWVPCYGTRSSVAERVRLRGRRRDRGGSARMAETSTG